MAQRLTGEQAKAWLAANPGASYIDNKTGQTITGQQTGLEKFAMGISQPFRAGGGILQEGAYTLADLYNLMKGNNQQVGQRPENYLGMTKEESQALYEDPLKVGLKAGAGVASYGLGGGANTAATTLGRIGQAVGKGVLAGGVGGFGYSENGKELSGTLGGAALGGVLGGALQGVGEIGKKVAQKATTPVVNEKLVKGSASKLKMTPDEFTINTRSTLQDMADNGFDVSSPKKIANSYPEYLNTVQKRVSTASQVAEGTPDLTELKTIYSDMVQDLKGNSGTTSRLKRLSEELFAKPNPTYEDVINYKMAIDKLGGGAVAVQKAGKSVTSQLMNAIRDETRSLASGDQALDTALNQFSTALKLKDTVLKNPEITTMMGIGGVLPLHSGVNVRPVIDALRPTGLGQKIAAGPIGKTQQLLGKLSTPAQRAIPGAVGLGMQIQPQIQTSTPEPTSTLTSSNTSAGQQLTTDEAIMKAIQTMPNGSESEIMSLAKMYLDQGTGTGLKVSAKDKNNAISGLNSLDQLESLLNSGTNLAPQVLGQGNLSAIAGNSDYKQYQALAKNVADIVARIRTGAQINQEEMKLYMKEFLPTWFDDAATKQRKLQQVRDYLGGIASGQVTPGTTSTTSTQ